jgi:hypothetical protein
MFECMAQYMIGPYLFVQLGSKLNTKLILSTTTSTHHPPKTVMALQNMLQGFLLFLFFS